MHKLHVVSFKSEERIRKFKTNLYRMLMYYACVITINPIYYHIVGYFLHMNAIMNFGISLFCNSIYVNARKSSKLNSLYLSYPYHLLPMSEGKSKIYPLESTYELPERKLRSV